MPRPARPAASADALPGSSPHRPKEDEPVGSRKEATIWCWPRSSSPGRCSAYLWRIVPQQDETDEKEHSPPVLQRAAGSGRIGRKPRNCASPSGSGMFAVEITNGPPESGWSFKEDSAVRRWKNPPSPLALRGLSWTARSFDHHPRVMVRFELLVERAGASAARIGVDSQHLSSGRAFRSSVSSQLRHLIQVVWTLRRLLARTPTWTSRRMRVGGDALGRCRRTTPGSTCTSLVLQCRRHAVKPRGRCGSSLRLRCPRRSADAPDPVRRRPRSRSPRRQRTPWRRRPAPAPRARRRTKRGSVHFLI